MTDPIGNRAEDVSPRVRAVRYFTDFSAGLEPHAVKQARLAEVRTLEAKSDAELFELGLLREDIVDFVYRDAHFV